MALYDIYPMGIDLAGGTELIYQLDRSEIDRRIVENQKKLDEAKAKQDTGEASADEIRRLEDTITALTQSKDSAPEKAADVVRNRVDPTGTKGIPITKYGSDRLRIQLPKASPEDVERIKRAIRTQGRLTFHLNVNPAKQQDVLEKLRASPTGEADGYKTVYIDHVDPYDPKKVSREPVYVEVDPMLEGSRIVNAYTKRGEQGGFEVDIQFDPKGGADFGVVTTDHVGENMAIVLDGRCYSNPVIKQAITNGSCVISGNFTEEDATRLSNILVAGSLPAEVVMESEFTVGPSLGQEQISSGVVATLIGALLVALFMWTYYRSSGFISVLCLGFNLTILLGALGFFKATMTLPGIAGILLTMGMAVDANVLIYERIREEAKRGRPIRLAVQHGFDRAFITILDSQLTTLFSGIILYYLGTGPVRGFAVTLSLGILVTLLANFWICRQIYDWLVSREAFEELKMMQFFENPAVDWMGMRRFWIGASGVLMALSFAGFLLMGVFSNRIYDLDFTGGTLVQFNFRQGQEQEPAKVEEAVEIGLRDTLRQNLESAAGKLEALAGSGKTGAELRHQLAVDLPVIGPTQFSESTEIAPESLTAMAGELRKTIQDWEGVKLDAQPFGEQVEGAGRYKSYTLTTRVIQPAVVELLGERLQEAFPGALEPRAVEVVDKAIRVRLERYDASAETTATNEELAAEVRKALEELAGEPEYEKIRPALLALKFEAVKDDEASGPTRAYVDLTPAPEDVLDRGRVLGTLRGAKLAHRVEGAISRKTQYGSQVSGEMRSAAFWAMMAALLGIFLYLWFRFEFSGAWGMGAIAALFHDALIAIGAVCLVNYTGVLPIMIDLNMVAAILTLIGYSVNDTIVVYDRIREVRAAHPTRDLNEIINEATNATLGRTILTSGTTLIAVLALFLLGGPTIRDLSFPFLIGIVVGTYSSIFIASPLMRWWYIRYGSGIVAKAAKSARERPASATADGAEV
ncbi:MAG: protein translocase subunit SecD [Planctomycetota bacterium]|nr:protein translocase subunit SecD [Planctomycetota bacterium]